MTQKIAHVVGIDISKDQLDVACLPVGHDQQFPNCKVGLQALVKWLGTVELNRVIFEASGRYHKGLEHALADANIPYVKVNALYARRFSQSLGRRAKTDKIDARMLAAMGTALPLDLSQPNSDVVEKLHDLVLAREALIKDRTAARNRSSTFSQAILKRQNEQRLKQIERHLKAHESECLAIIASDDELKRLFAILSSIPGVGTTTTITMLAEMPELGNMDKRQTAALAGLAPMTRESGNWKGKSFIQGGRGKLRHALYMPALVAIRYNPTLKVKYDDLIQRGKPFKVAITVIMRKLIIIANALVRDNRKWSDNIA